MARRPLYMQTRQQYVRTGPYDLLREGSVADGSYGWTTDIVPVGGHGNVRWGDWPNAPKPAWYLGDDSFDGRPIGPNGPETSVAILPAVTRCTEIITNAIVRTPWRYFTTEGEFMSRPLWIDDPMLIGSAPGPIGPLSPAGVRMDGHSFFATWITHAVWWGRGAFVFIEDSAGQPLAGSLRILNPYMIAVDETGHWVIDPKGESPVRTNFDGRFIVGGQIWRLVVLRGLGPNDDRTPEGVISRHWNLFKLGASVTEYVASTFASGVPAGFLKVTTPNFKQPDSDKLRDDWMSAHGKGRRSIAVLNATVDFQPISISPLDANVEGVIHAHRNDVAHAFGLSAIWLDEGASGLTYQNNSDRRRDLVDISLAGWSERVMAVLTAILPYRQRVEVNWTSFTTPNIEAHMNALVQGVQTGIITATEAREFLGLARPAGPDPAWADRSPAVTGSTGAAPAIEGAPA
jgi:HK97 family phage portal protein